MFKEDYIRFQIRTCKFETSSFLPYVSFVQEINEWHFYFNRMDNYSPSLYSLFLSASVLVTLSVYFLSKVSVCCTSFSTSLRASSLDWITERKSASFLLLIDWPCEENKILYCSQLIQRFVIIWPFSKWRKDNSAVFCSVPRSSNGSEAVGDHVLMKTSPHFCFENQNKR